MSGCIALGEGASLSLRELPQANGIKTEAVSIVCTNFKQCKK